MIDEVRNEIAVSNEMGPPLMEIKDKTSQRRVSRRKLKFIWMNIVSRSINVNINMNFILEKRNFKI